MYNGELPEKEFDEYKMVFNTIPALMVVRGSASKEELISRIQEAIAEGKEIPDDDPIYQQFEEGMDS